MMKVNRTFPMSLSGTLSGYDHRFVKINENFASYWESSHHGVSFHRATDLEVNPTMVTAPSNSVTDSITDSDSRTRFPAQEVSILDTWSSYAQESLILGVGSWCEATLRTQREGASTATPKYSEHNSKTAQSQEDPEHSKGKDEEILKSAPAYVGHGNLSRTQQNKQAMLLVSRSSIWIFPGLSKCQLDAIFSKRGIVTVPSRPSRTSGSLNKQGGDTPSQSASRRGGIRKSHGSRGGSFSTSGTNQRNMTRGEEPPYNRKSNEYKWFACPFSKHNPRRYLSVYGKMCTLPPGMEYKRVK